MVASPNNISKHFYMFIRLIAVFALAIGFARGAVVTDFSDIQYWVGSGTNEAALVIQWNDGKSPVSLAWGFRWDDAATGWDMIQAITAADSNLTIQSSVDPTYGHYIYQISYSVDSRDQNGSDGGFWGYDVGEGATLPGTASSPDWAFSDFGVDFRVLNNQSWDAWNYTLDYLNPPAMETPVAAVAAVPEPRTITLLALLGVVFWCKSRNISWRSRSQAS